METTLAQIVKNKNEMILKPFKNWHMLLLFVIPAAVMYFCIYCLWPYFAGMGIPEEIAFVTATSVTTGGMFLASIIAYFLEGNPCNWHSFKKRFRLETMNGKSWIWALCGLVALLLISFLANSLLVAVYKLTGFVPPSITPNVKTISLVVVMLLLNILGEEFWWRGYIQPRQELNFGKKTFIVHGMLWALFHLFKWWAVPAMLVVCMVIPFVVQRTKSTVPGLLIHLIQNGLGIVMLLI